MKKRIRKLRVGDWVEVRSKEEILETLDSHGQLDGMPFMPEMFAFCGKRFQVYKRAHKTCDTVFPVRGRRVAGAVHLGTRCDGSAHGGCQASCLIFWKEAWLKLASGKYAEDANFCAKASAEHPTGAISDTCCTQPDVFVWATNHDQAGPEPVYICQATRLPYATSDLAWWDLRQYAEDYTSGNEGLWQIFCGAFYFLYIAISQAGLGLGRPMRWFYDKFHTFWGGTPFPRRAGLLPEGHLTPSENLDLQPGELIRIKSFEEIRKTLDTSSKNRGLYFDAEEVPYCGGTYQVLKRVTKIIDERTGRMQQMKTPCIILDSVVCKARYSECRLFCPRSIYPYWREIWLERVQAKSSGPRVNEQDQVAAQ